MIVILLATYNGGRFLSSQIDSILAQTYTDWVLHIRDDGSTDNTLSVIREYTQRYPSKIIFHQDDRHLGVCHSFLELLRLAKGNYYMFCDQDDVWLPQKVEKTFAAIKSAEGDGKMPVLVHTDLKVVDQNLDVISPSFFNFQKLIQDDITLSGLLVQNYVTGCTIMINRALKEKCGAIPQSCIMHDWWLALAAVAFGRLVCVNEPTMLYRQHSGNQVGAKASYGIAFIKRKLATLDKVRENYNATYTQAKTFLDCYGNLLESEQKKIIDLYCRIPQMNKFEKIRTIQKYGFKKCTRLRVIGQYFFV